MMCTYGLNYQQSIVYLCSSERKAPPRARAREGFRRRERKKERNNSPDGSAEVQIKANDLIVRRRVERR